MEVETIFMDTFFGKTSNEHAGASIRVAVMGVALGLVKSLNNEASPRMPPFTLEVVRQRWNLFRGFGWVEQALIMTKI